MTIPNKSDLTSALRRFAQELRDIAKTYQGSVAAQLSLEEVTGIARIAEKAAESIDDTNRNYVHPDTAQTLAGLADQIAAVADESTDDQYATSLKIASVALRTFVFRQTPFVTGDGLKFGE